MKEEYGRLIEAEQFYKKQIDEEKRNFSGSVCLKFRGKNEYLYLQRREGEKIVHEYIGEVHSKKAIAALESVNKRKKHEEYLKDISNTLKDVKKVLRGKI
jgi:hypothetical protein